MWNVLRQQRRSIEWKFMIYGGVTRGFNDASHFIFPFLKHRKICGIYFWNILLITFYQRLCVRCAACVRGCFDNRWVTIRGGEAKLQLLWKARNGTMKRLTTWVWGLLVGDFMIFSDFKRRIREAVLLIKFTMVKTTITLVRYRSITYIKVFAKYLN